jgi:cobyrinic acid a,c-diamide synthase
MSPRGLVVAGIRSGSGKTTVALGLMRALTRRGLTVQAFKCGPDYIDPAFHAAATGRPGFNLDTWAMAPELIADVVALPGKADIALAEGVMGLFDGVGGRGATADLAAMLHWPVVLVLDVKGQTETAAAIAAGCASYRSDISVAGVILNRVASARHLSLIQPSFERIGMRLFGALGDDPWLTLPERHLGLVQAGEMAALERRLDALGEAIAGSVDLDALQAAVRPAVLAAGAAKELKPPGQRIALARDRSFSFTYSHLLEQWRRAGAEILPFSPLGDEPPAVSADAIWLPGGYPELHGGTLSAARRFHEGLRAEAARSVPIHGECGGYMVLGQGIEDADGARHAMTGLLRLETSFAHRRLHLGYRRATLRLDCALGKAGSDIMGHEFHYASVLSTGDEPLALCHDAHGVAVEEQGARRGSVSGTFFHAISAGRS